ncbi:AbrB family transcriptional regulator [Hyphomicrobium sp.]|uniref:AbrB family transcriptional regulator n=1 Tax=Hyphomicrobium sp. TaxID=82 RepID=UPI002D779F45|nr:AbrB family transcriptional regulator [Hyphomicrobium sp.]HET6389360.1 AbrB family transcriptional regulator [Hyphomicrobium sp.]
MTRAPSVAASPSLRWGVLIVLSAIFAYVLNAIGIPAALLLGPLIAGIIVAFEGATPEVPRLGFGIAQGVVGCMIAKTIPDAISGDIVGNWPLFTTGVLAVVAASAGLGWLLARLRVLPGTTIVWGRSPGAATAMTLMAEAFGADAQLVAIMQYTRVIIVAATASVITKFAGSSATHAVSPLLPNDWLSFGETLLLAFAAPLVARRLRFRAGALLIPLVAGILLQHRGLLTIDLPRWVLAIAYAFIGWHIGLRFNRPLLVHAARKMPIIIGSTLALVAVCGALAAGLVLLAGIDPLTAYLATSPGGADSVAIIAASTHVDTPFVMTMQMARFVVVLIVGPAIARFTASRVPADIEITHT